MNIQSYAILAVADQQYHVRILAGMASGAREPRRSRVMYALLHLEAGDTRLKTVRGVVKALEGRVRLTQRLHRLLRRLVELDHGLLDLLGGERLRLHTLMHALEARRERL